MSGDEGMSKNHFWVVLLKGEAPQLFTSWPECEKRVRGVSRVVYHGFATKEEADRFIAGKWREKPISGETAAWLEEYKAREGQLKQDTELDTSALSAVTLPKYGAYVDGSYDPKSHVYGFGVVFLCDGRIEKYYGGGSEEKLAEMGSGAGELLACMEAIKHAETLGLPEFTIFYDSELISWAYHGCGEKMLTQAVGQYMYDIRNKMELKVMSIEGVSHTAVQGPGIVLADQLARKGAGMAAHQTNDDN